ncbi:MAG: TetR/AcrR family transcriptional regulator [bacterium]|nr:TetR/AcrR family transcriptional regulator [bacterium]
MDTKTKILEKTKRIFAQNGYEAFSMRILAKEVPIAPSVLYHYFEDKDALLKSMFDYLNTDLGQKRSQLPVSRNASEMLKNRIIFQLDNSEAIVAVLKYFMAFRKKFPQFEEGYLPDKSSLHIEEVLRLGISSGEFYSPNLKHDAKVITHAINGFLLEYYPDIPLGNEKTNLVENIHQFLIRALMKGGDSK